MKSLSLDVMTQLVILLISIHNTNSLYTPDCAPFHHGAERSTVTHLFVPSEGHKFTGLTGVSKESEKRESSQHSYVLPMTLNPAYLTELKVKNPVPEHFQTEIPAAGATETHNDVNKSNSRSGQDGFFYRGPQDSRESITGFEDMLDMNETLVGKSLKEFVENEQLRYLTQETRLYWNAVATQWESWGPLTIAKFRKHWIKNWGEPNYLNNLHLFHFNMMRAQSSHNVWWSHSQINQWTKDYMYWTSMIEVGDILGFDRRSIENPFNELTRQSALVKLAAFSTRSYWISSADCTFLKGLYCTPKNQSLYEARILMLIDSKLTSYKYLEELQREGEGPDWEFLELRVLWFFLQIYHLKR